MSIAFVQEGHNDVTGTSLSVIISPTGSGNLLVVQLTYIGSNSTAFSINDGVNTYHLVAGGTTNNGIYGTSFWYAYNISSGVTSISISRAPSSHFFVSVQEFSGAGNNDPFISAGTTGGSGNDQGPTLTPTGTGQLLVSMLTSTNVASFGVQAPWTGIAFNFSGDAYYINPPVSSQFAQFTPVGNVNFIAVGAVFQSVSSFTLSLSDSVSFSDSITNEDDVSVSDSITSSDTLALIRTQNVSDSMTVTDSLSAQSSFIASNPIPTVETLTNFIIPSEVKTFYKFQ